MDPERFAAAVEYASTGPGPEDREELSTARGESSGSTRFNGARPRGPGGATTSRPGSGARAGLQRGPAQRTGRSRLVPGPYQPTHWASTGPGPEDREERRSWSAWPTTPETLQRGPAQRTGRSHERRGAPRDRGSASTGPGPEDREERKGGARRRSPRRGFNGARPRGPGGASRRCPRSTRAGRLQRGPAQRTGRSHGHTAWTHRGKIALQRGPAQRTGRSGPGDGHPARLS